MPNKDIWTDRINTVREKGLAAIVAGNMERWFTKDFRDREPEKTRWITEMFLTTKPEGYIACGEAVRDMDHREIIRSITAPTLVIAGRHDPATTVEAGEFIRKSIPGASMTVLEAAHIANVEQAQKYTETMLGFLLQK
jgi:3-oxoadipate enol-lactonase